MAEKKRPRELRIILPPRRLPRSGKNSSHPSAAWCANILQGAGIIRSAAILFWVVMMLFMWPFGEYIGWIARLVGTAWVSLICGGGLLVLHRLERQAILEQRRASGCCLRCGYDLRATPDRCPECGMIPTEPMHQGAVEHR